jgi:hypothetical protein
MREVTPQELREYNEKSWKETQKIFRRRLREIAAGGNKKAKYKPNDYCFGERIQPWLEGLGFKIKQVNPIWSEITWPEEEVGTWTKDRCQWDYTCSECGKHAEYVSNYCPNCGKEMKVEEGEDKYV